MIPSAVVVPEEPTRSPSPSLKRRHSSLSSESSKRPRLESINGDQESPLQSTGAMSPPSQRRKLSALGSSAAEERRRGQRLFGALLGNLSQPSAKPAHRRRDEIEKRQQDKLRQRDEELEEEKRKNRAKIDAVRKEEQKAWDEESMRIRHKNMQATAHFLKTKTDPPLYYKPWDLRPIEEDTIARQIKETEETINQELAEHAARKGAETGMNEVHPPVSKLLPSSTEKQEQKPDSIEEDKREHKPELVGADIATNKQDDHDSHDDTTTMMMNTDEADEAVANEDDVDRSPTSERKQDEQKPHDDHGGEELVEGQEDDVIY